MISTPILTLACISINLLRSAHYPRAPALQASRSRSAPASATCSPSHYPLFAMSSVQRGSASDTWDVDRFRANSYIPIASFGRENVINGENRDRDPNIARIQPEHRLNGESTQTWNQIEMRLDGDRPIIADIIEDASFTEKLNAECTGTFLKSHGIVQYFQTHAN